MSSVSARLVAVVAAVGSATSAVVVPVGVLHRVGQVVLLIAALLCGVVAGTISDHTGGAVEPPGPPSVLPVPEPGVTLGAAPAPVSARSDADAAAVRPTTEDGRSTSVPGGAETGSPPQPGPPFARPGPLVLGRTPDGAPVVAEASDGIVVLGTGALATALFAALVDQLDRVRVASRLRPDGLERVVARIASASCDTEQGSSDRRGSSDLRGSCDRRASSDGWVSSDGPARPAGLGSSDQVVSSDGWVSSDGPARSVGRGSANGPGSSDAPVPAPSPGGPVLRVAADRTVVGGRRVRTGMPCGTAAASLLSSGVGGRSAGARESARDSASASASASAGAGASARASASASASASDGVGASAGGVQVVGTVVLAPGLGAAPTTWGTAVDVTRHGCRVRRRGDPDGVGQVLRPVLPLLEPPSAPVGPVGSVGAGG